jgi:Tol biopolymer transport system component
VTARLTTNAANDWFPVWSPDGQRILFGTDREGGPAMRTYVKNSMDPGSGEAPLVDSGISSSEPEDWSRSGNWISFRSVTPATGNDLWILPASANKSPFAFLATPFLEASGRFSPDEKWISYISTESGRYEVYVRPFSGGPAAPTGKIQVSNNGADFPLWSRDGRELFFIGGDSKLYSVKTAGFGSGTAPPPTALFTPCGDTSLATLPLRSVFYSYPYDVSPDGQRFLMVCSTLGPGRFDVMLNWQKTLK